MRWAHLRLRIPYDVEGVNETECDYYIPEEYLGDAVYDFFAYTRKKFGATEDFINDVLKNIGKIKRRKVMSKRNIRNITKLTGQVARCTCGGTMYIWNNGSQYFGRCNTCGEKSEVFSSSFAVINGQHKKILDSVAEAEAAATV